MNSEFFDKGGTLKSSPLSAVTEIPTIYLLNFLSKHEGSSYMIGELLRTRKKTILYQVNSKFRGDPYPGALAAIDYLICREGKSFEERDSNLVMVWGKIEIDDINKTFKVVSNKASINDFISSVQSSENKNILSKDYRALKNSEIPRYYMQVRYGSTYSKAKHIRVYSYFADAILFKDGSLWRDA